MRWRCKHDASVWRLPVHWAVIGITSAGVGVYAGQEGGLTAGVFAAATVAVALFTTISRRK